MEEFDRNPLENVKFEPALQPPGKIAQHTLNSGREAALDSVRLHKTTCQGGSLADSKTHHSQSQTTLNNDINHLMEEKRSAKRVKGKLKLNASPFLAQERSRQRRSIVKANQMHVVKSILLNKKQANKDKSATGTYRGRSDQKSTFSSYIRLAPRPLEQNNNLLDASPSTRIRSERGLLTSKEDNRQVAEPEGSLKGQPV
jgi:hypothetical protein